MPSYAIHGSVQPLSHTAVDSDVNDPAATYIANDTPAQAQHLDFPIRLGGYLNLPYRGANGDSFAVGDLIDMFSVDLKPGYTLSLTLGDDARRNDLDLVLMNDRMEIIDGSFGVGAAETLTITDAHLQQTVYVAVVLCGSTLYRCDPLPADYVGATTYILNIDTNASSLQSDESLHLSDAFVPGEIIARFNALPDIATAPRGLAKALGVIHAPPRRAQRMLLDHTNSSSGLRAASGGMGASAVNPDEMQTKLDTLMAVKALRRRIDVSVADLNYRRAALLTPGDSGFRYQWHYQMINLPVAWDVTRGYPLDGNLDVIVAVIDTGVLVNHPDLQGKLVAGYDFIKDVASARDGDGMDEDANDPGDLAYGTRSTFHGTHVAGTIAAASNNNLGAAGVSWGAKIMPLRVLGKGGGTSYDVMQAVLYAGGLDNDSGSVPAQRADVINLSLGGGGYSKSEQDAFTRARGAGVLIVAAAGNNNSSTPSYPASYEGVTSVSAVDSKYGRASYSNFGPLIDIAAPGGTFAWDANNDGQLDGIYSTAGNDSSGTIEYTYRLLTGTSMASPHVAGVIALMKAVNPQLTPDAFDTLLASGALTQDIGAPGRDNDFGYGLIDAFKAVTAATGQIPTTPALVAFPNGLNFAGNLTRLTLAVGNGGGGSLHVQAAQTTATWLTLQPLVDANGLGSYMVNVDRRNLATGDYSATITLQSDANTVTVPVFMSVAATSTSATLASAQWIVLIDAQTQQPVASTQAALGTHGYEFTFTGVTAGDYYVVIGSDLDNDKYICDRGEACGTYSANGEILSLAVRDRDVADISLNCGFDISPAVPASARFALPNTGVTRLISSH
ncbi:MAG: S8 family peptidase [Gammaproteobacteria bacterium]|nr:S8 family peptidase [Gammaproteobacteria bacterium]